MALTTCARCKRDWRANSGVEPCPWCRSEAAEAEVAKLTAICKATLDNLGVVNDDDPTHLPNHAADVAADAKAGWKDARMEAEAHDKTRENYWVMRKERDAAVAAREAAVEALRGLYKSMFIHEGEDMVGRVKGTWSSKAAEKAFALIASTIAGHAPAPSDHISQPGKMVSERERLVSAYLAGFEASAEGWNGEILTDHGRMDEARKMAVEYAESALAGTTEDAS